MQELGHPIEAVEFMDDAIQGSLFDKRFRRIDGDEINVVLVCVVDEGGFDEGLDFFGWQGVANTVAF